MSKILPDDTIQRMKTRDPSLITSEQDGTRKISIGLLTPPSSNSSRSASSSSSVSVEARFITVPMQLDSPQAFEFLCFTKEKAEHLFQRKQAKERETETEFEMGPWAMDYVEHACRNARDSSDDWAGIMRQAGIKEEICVAIMQPCHDSIRYIQSLSAWLKEIIDTNYLALLNLNSKILEDLETPFVNMRGGSGGDQENEEYTVPQMPGGHIALFKSVEFLRTVNCISEDGTIDFDLLRSFGPMDFSRTHALYFTHQLWVAKHYSKLINDTCAVADRRTVEIHVPLSHFNDVKTWSLKFEDDDFKRLIYYSRRNQLYPKDLSKKRAAYGVIQGPIAHNHNRHFGDMSHWSLMTPDHQLTDKNDPPEARKVAQQWVWIKDETIEKLAEVCIGKAFLRRPEKGFRLIPQPWKDFAGSSA